VDREYLSGGIRLSCPSTLQLLSHPWSLLEFIIVCLCLAHEFLGHVLSMWPNCPTTKYFSGPSRHTGQGRKRSCPYSLCPNPSTPMSD
jgi:hypothetical protein